MSLRHFFEELKRRHVMRVTGVYLVAAYAVVQGAATVFPLLNLPASAATAVLIVAILGLPVVVLLAWVFDITPEGVRRTPDAVEGAPALTVEQQLEAHRRRFAARAVAFVGVGVLVALVGFAAFSMSAKEAPSGQIESLAVLPFVDLSPNRDQEYFSDGVTEELLNRVAQIAGLRVAARTSSFAFKGQNPDVRDVGNRLKVDAVLEGSVRRDGDNVRITARLIDAKTGTQIWSNTYERKVSSVFAIQDEISTEIVEALKEGLAAQAAPIEGEESGTRNAQAADLYFKGLKALNERTEDQLRTALQYFEQAAQVDTTYAAAYSGLAKTYAVLPAFTNYPVVDALRKGTSAAARAIALNPRLGDAYAALGQISQNLEWDLPSALRNYRRAVKFEPNNATAHQWFAEALLMTGDPAQALAEVDLALDQDPLSASAKNVRAYITLVRGDQAGALRLYQNLVREAPTFRLGQLNYALAAIAAKEWGSATEALIAALPEHAPDAGLLIAAASGQIDGSMALNAVKGIEGSISPSIAALLYAAIGAHNVALEKIQSIYSTGNDANLPYILLHPLLQPVRKQPRFEQITRAIGIALPAQ